ncbi:hypothetical protein DPEC_G00187950 [Dallia pectoralis]|uniref:Uncharacterized protein n=1 Tax=Dallia pectoralis TaxID=75939 RepID=A0ACC2GC53_DALPE|nr:hypothetical protein DPEC_G00187950 [Dallia pectoralis]
MQPIHGKRRRIQRTRTLVAPNPTNNDLHVEILSLKGYMAKQSTDMLKAINKPKNRRAQICAVVWKSGSGILWLKSSTVSPIIERAHRIGPFNPQSTSPRAVVMKFLNYRDRETALRTARKMTEARYENQRVPFFPDLSAETRKLQLRFNGVKNQLRALHIRYGILYPSHLIITHNDKRRIFKSVAEEYIRGISSQTCDESGT